ncbi:MAG: hypothetical protein AAF768_04045 [Pseudomonadota bacterium]
MDIRADLGVSYKAYSSWAKLYGFRQEDLFPDQPRAGARVSTPPGPGGYVKSGRYTEGLGLPEDDPRRITGEGHPGWTGGEGASRARYGRLRDGQRDAALAKVAELSAGQLLVAVREALDAGELSAADRLLRAWRAQGRREAGLEALEAAAAAEWADPELPEDWRPGDELSLAQLSAMGDYALYVHLCALGGRVAVAECEWGGFEDGEV